MKIAKDGHVLEVSRKAFEIVYKPHGYTEYTEEAKPKKPAKTRTEE